MSVHYDDLDINRDIRLDLPLREGAGIITQDVARPHHPVALVGAPAWTTLDSNLGVLTLDGTEYGESLNADTADLEPTSGDYSVGGWVYIDTAGVDSQIMIGRWQEDVGGWELYHYTNLLMTMRHHHAGGVAVRSGCYSAGWTYNTWHFLGFSRVGANGFWYRNGVSIANIGVLEDPEATTSDLVIGVRYSKNANFHTGMFWRYRYWGDRALTQAEWAWIYERELRWFA